MLAKQALQKTLLVVRKRGLPRTLHDVTLKVVNSVFPYKVLKGISISRVDPDFLKCPDGYTAMFLSQSMLRHFAGDPIYQMPASFLNEALSKGDECYAICDGETLAAYGWYSTKPTRMDLPDLLVHFGEQYVYMYKGFTHAPYRGQRLYPIGMSLALQNYQSRGYTGLVSYVESNNFDSLRSCARMGFDIFGSAHVGKVFGHYFRHCSRGCAKLGFRVEREAAQEPELHGADPAPTRFWLKVAQPTTPTSPTGQNA